jgi:hypothetical protein
MSGYTPQVGDRVWLSHWHPDSFVTVTAVGIRKMLAEDRLGYEHEYICDADWAKVPEPITYPERWMNVYGGDVMFVAHMSHRSADFEASTGRIAVIHLAADGTLTLHPVERES